jgi:hypothetical protein
MVQQNKSNKNASKGGRAVKKKGPDLSAKKKIVHGSKVAKATAKLGARMSNPKNIAKMVKNAAKGKGLVLPGSNYIGPGNPMNRKVKSKGDALAKKHDEDYQRYLDAGFSKKKVYAGFSDADKRLMKKSNLHTPEGVATFTGMKAKQLLHKTGLTGKKLTNKDLIKKEKKKSEQKMKGTVIKDEL